MPMVQSMRTLTSSKSNDWCTPPHIIRRVKRALGGRITLDPASNAHANAHIVKADTYLDVSVDGLSMPWLGLTVFLNPPYNKVGNRSSAEVWGTYMVDQYQRGNFREGIMLTKTVPGYDWWDDFAWRKLWPGPFCITYGRLSFVHLDWITDDGAIVYPSDCSNVSKTASTLWYLGNDATRFAAAFHDIGHTIYR